MYLIIIILKKNIKKKIYFSWVFPYFRIFDNSYYICSKCDKKYKQTTSSGNLFEHLSSAHNITKEKNAKYYIFLINVN